MRANAGTLLGAIVLLSGLSSAGNLPVQQEIFNVDETPVVIRLSHNDVIRNTLTIAANGRTLTEDQYILDVPSGSIRILATLDPPVKITVSYSYLWIHLPSYYFKRKLTSSEVRPGGGGIQPSYGRTVQQKPPKSSSQLRIFGSKSVGLKAGTGTDLELNQTLNVQLDGYLAENLKVTGVLSDQSSPDVGGISTTLGEIDHVALKLSSNNFSADIGDIVFDRQFGAGSRFTKTLKGGQAAIHSGNIGGDLTVGGIKSKHGSLRTFGRDGVAGPYKLFPNGNRAIVSVLPGTDHVWLDGRPLLRGADADYQIDYLNGELTFSTRITITSRSRIEADFEYLDENYRQDFYAGSFEYGDTTAIASCRVDFLRQIDSKNNPSRLEPASGDAALLAAAGDSASRAVRSGVTKVDSASGSYIQEVIDADTLYRFVGVGNGDYQVNFSYFGEGKGDYRYLGGGAYEYVAKDGGAYLPVVFVPLPERADAVSLSSQIGGDIISVQFNGIVSDHDENLASNLDDGNNVGSDLTARLALSPLGSSNTDDLTLETDVDARRIEREFFLPGRKFEVERDREWGLRSDSVLNVSEEISLHQKIGLARYGSLSGNVGSYRDRNFVTADRYGYSGELRPLDGLSVTVNRSDRRADELDTVSASRLFDDEAAISWHLGALSAFGRWKDETDLRPIDTTNAGRRFDRYSSGVAYGGASIDLSYENREIGNNDWQREFDSREMTFSYTGYGGLVNSKATANISHRRVHDFIPARYDQSQLTTSLDYQLGGGGNPFDLTLNYRMSREGADRSSESFIKVGEGEGEYRLENGVYVADPFGNYIRVVELLGAEEVGVTISRGLTLYMRPEQWNGCPESLGFLKRISTETHIRTSEQGGANEKFRLGWIVPYMGVFESTRLNYEKNLRQSARVDFGDGVALFSSFEENRIARPRQTPTLNNYGLTFLNRVDLDFRSRLIYSIEHRFKRLDQDSRSYGDASFIEHRIANTIRYRPSPQYELVFKPAYLVDMSRVSDLQVAMWEAAFEASRQVAHAGRLSGRFAYQTVSSSAADQFVPFQYAAGRRIGDNFQWGATLDIRFSRTVSASLSYDGEKIPGLRTRNISSMSVKARF